jgi:flagellar hook-basal body complex protein FliE
MDDMKVKNVLSDPSSRMENRQSVRHDPVSDFQKVLSQSLGEVNQKLTEADQSVQEMVLGKKDIHQAMIAIEQANLSLRMVIQIRNKLVTAYEELMRMQI